MFERFNFLYKLNSIKFMNYKVILLITLVISPLIYVNAYGHDYVRLIIETNSIESLSNKYDIRILEELRYTLNGYIIDIRSDQLNNLIKDKTIKNIYYDQPLKIVNNSQSNLESIGLDSKFYNNMTLTGKGVVIGMIDTGVDYKHNDLKGKVIGGYDFLDNKEDPIDKDGHGTMVAGIIAANGAIKGVAPEAKLIVYKIASGNRYVSTSEIISVMERAARDHVNILNISIGLDRIDEVIDRAVNNLVDKGIIVVTAAGNNGEKGLSSINSPGSAMKAITVGATLNSIHIPLFATLKVLNSNETFHPIPMEDTVPAFTPIVGKLVFAKYAREEDLKDLDVNGKIVLAERGGEIKIVNGKEEKELVYFSDKEYNVANKGGKALIVYNNEPGIFRGKLIHDKNREGYKPRIPTVSLSKEEGMLLKGLLEKNKELWVELRVYSDPNVVADFSSKGPVSPFYIKPDIVAPGVMINSTYLNNSYNLATGTSFAAPHVTGAAALLLELHPDLKPQEIASLLINTADPLLDPYGNYYPIDVAGNGRLNITRALHTNIVAYPYYAILHVTPTLGDREIIKLRSIKGSIGDINAYIKFFSPIDLDLKLDINKVDKSEIDLIINVYNNTKIVDGKYEGRIYIEERDQRISIPIIIYTSTINVNVLNTDGKIKLALNVDKEWESAKIDITDPENRFKRIITLTPSNNVLDVRTDGGEYWINISVLSHGKVTNGSITLYVNNIQKDPELVYFIDNIIPFKEGLLILGFLSIVSIAVIILKVRRRKRSIIEDFY